MKIIWHYWCGASKPGADDRYIKYLLLSANSLIKIGGVDGDRVYVTLDQSLFNHPYCLALRELGINILPAPLYRNHSKQYGYIKLINELLDVDKIVQLDCDTIISRGDIEKEIKLMDECLYINRADDGCAYNILLNREGQPFYSNFISMSPKNDDKFHIFRDMMKLVFDADVDGWIEHTKKETCFYGYIYVINTKKLPADFLKFMGLMNLFFEDDEFGLSFAIHHFKINYGRVNPLNVMPGTYANHSNLSFVAGSMEEFDKLIGIVHYPYKTKEVHEEMLRRAEEVLKTL